ncbi:ABC transporter related [Beutenbergia cavernae DSM 12333]|uniref:ABC transporter related n=1 Tax=Beutenbergia cavernae (strain ATCC BAA-8 / DSM 12333 / CCUG 43141 / JCM 11478 / NBRC 16432 / NCIMB 13614 / HKI 0122) TaxID=471853 RepID=C5C4K1_BEUC1|nr:ATP-binding cassette domain-containing protein [Beutenbergia cavernae]ACQ82125.1 ABC transporter related [Beutenbergia cavernae DSM 12333]
MIHTEGLTKTFTRGKETVEAVKGVDVDVAEGELVAFLGPNGAGKSTTLRMLTGLLAPTAGSARVAGVDVVTRPAHVRQRIGYIGQGNGAGHSYRVLDELVTQGRFYGIPTAEALRRATDLIASMQLDGLEKRTVSTLSGGQRRRLDVAMGLMNHPPLLFLDEPTTGMDPQSRANLWEHILRMRAEFGMTIVLTTHYLEEADRMAERVVVIDHGSIIADARPEVLRLEHAADVITLRFAPDDVGTARSALGADLRFAPAIAQSGDDALLLTLDRGAEALPDILYRLDAAGVRPASATIAEATLDDVFLNLTGRSLREEGAAA